MAKEDYTTPLADEYILTHKELIEKKQKWYEKYLPAGVTAKDITSKHEEKFIDIFSSCEDKADKYLEEIALNGIEKHLKGLMDESLKKYLPLRPKIIWEDLTVDQKTDLTKLFKNCVEKGFNEKIIKKEIRKYVEEFIEQDKQQKLKGEDIQSLLEKWIDDKINEKGYVSKGEDYTEFKQIFNLAERTFSTRLRNSSLIFKKGKWIRE